MKKNKKIIKLIKQWNTLLINIKKSKKIMYNNIKKII